MDMIDVLIADDHRMFVEALTALLSASDDIRIRATASNGEEAIAIAEANDGAAVLVMDIRMPLMDGISAAKIIRRRCPSVRIIALTDQTDSGSITRAIKAGVDGYVIKTSAKEEFLAAIRSVAAGKQYFGDRLTGALIGALRGENEKVLGGDPPISEREKEILRLIAMEFTTNEIADKLFLSHYTVETHRKNLIHKLGVRNTAGLVRMAIQLGLISCE